MKSRICLNVCYHMISLRRVHFTGSPVEYTMALYSRAPLNRLSVQSNCSFGQALNQYWQEQRILKRKWHFVCINQVEARPKVNRHFVYLKIFANNFFSKPPIQKETQ